MSVRKKKTEDSIAGAVSGTSETLLTGVRTAHFVLKLPSNLAQENSPICHFRKNGSRGRLLRQSKLLVLDEIMMVHKKAIGVLNLSLQDLRDSTDIMGGMLVLLDGAFRQTLPVIQRGTPAVEIIACIKSSRL
ncbi:ATP-dependent DNA helicase [Trichonephila clavipes]|nr:ATP-dependent DNA helicase [Trichonephila clavipes]